MSEELKKIAKGFEPKIMAFVCNWCTYAGADLAGTSHCLAQGVLILYLLLRPLKTARTACSSRVVIQGIVIIRQVTIMLGAGGVHLKT